MDCITSHSEGGAGDDEMVPCSPLGGRTGGEKSAATLCTNIIAGVVLIRIFFPPIVSPGGRGGTTKFTRSNPADRLKDRGARQPPAALANLRTVRLQR